MISSGKKSLRIKETATAATALGLSVLAIVLSQNINLRMGDSGLNARWWPTVLSISSALLSSMLVLSALFLPIAADEEAQPAQKNGWLRVIIVLAISSLYVFAWARIGYIIPTAVYLFALLWIFGVRSKTVLFFYPVLTTAFIYSLFHTMLRVPL